MNKNSIAFLGSTGIPNRYGGFESFLENCAPEIANRGYHTIVTCDSSLYEDKATYFENVERVFIPIKANGWQSVFHDMLAFILTFRKSKYFVVLGVSAGPLLLLMRLICTLTNKRLIINVDGIEWRRSKFSKFKRLILKLFDFFAQASAHVVIIDNPALERFLFNFSKRKFKFIAYSGDHVLKNNEIFKKIPGKALTICRIEPENQLELMIQGALSTEVITEYVIIGNWNHSDYSKELRKKYSNSNKIKIIDPIYDQKILHMHRSNTQFYLHGHSVGGTNPSLVEMLFYNCNIIAFDCDFNRNTAKDAAHYFTDKDSVVTSINLSEINPNSIDSKVELRKKYTASSISDSYLSACFNTEVNSQ